MKTLVLSTMLIGFGCVAAAAEEDSPLPGAWTLESHPSVSRYRIGLDRETRHGGKSAGFLASQDAEFKNNNFTAYAALRQSIDVSNYRGKRLRISAFMKTQDVKNQAYLKVSIPHLFADNEDSFRQKQRIQGTTDWTRYEVEFAVSHLAGIAEIDCGVNLIGPGRIWIDDVSLEVLGNTGDIPPTAPAKTQPAESPPTLFDQLANTDFEQTLLEYDLSLLQGLWEINTPAEKDSRMISIIRRTKQIQGNKETDTDYTQQGIWQQLTYDFQLERSGRFSLITRRNTEVTQGMAKGSRSPEGFARSIPYTVNRSQFVEILQLLDGDKGPPILRQWNRVPAK
jgi:hypothetical protein